MGLTSGLGEPKVGVEELAGVLKRSHIFPRVPVTPPKIGSPKGSPKGGTDGDPEGSPHNPADPHRGPSSNPADPHPGSSSNPADQAHPEAPNEPVGTTPKSLLIGESKDFNTLPPKGRQLDDDLHKAIRANEQDVTLPKLTDNYKVEGKDRNSKDIRATDLAEPFQDIGLDINRAKYSQGRVYSKEQGSKGTVVGSRYFDQDRTIVAEELFAGNDKNPEGKRIRSSDIVFLQWNEFASHTMENGKLQSGMANEVNQLENFIARNIQSRSTVETIEAAHQKTNQPLLKRGTFPRGGTGAQKESFEALLGTDIVASFQYMLKDHHRALGNKRIAEVITYPRAYDPKTQQGRQKITMTLRPEAWNP